MPTPGAIVVALQLQGGAAPAPEAAADLTKLILEASPVVQGVVALLLFSSVLSWAIVFYKAVSFRRLERQSATFLDVFRRSTKFSEVQAVCKSLAESPFQAGSRNACSAIARGMNIRGRCSAVIPVKPGGATPTRQRARASSFRSLR